MELKSNESSPENFLKYLGTSGGRFSMIRQQRSTGGLCFSYGGLRGVIDPGPGALSRLCASSLPFASDELDVVMLTHKHIDHSTDVNVMIECMTHGGFETRGTLVAPEDALYGEDPVVMKYSKKRVPVIEVPKDGRLIALERGVTAEPVLHLHHRVDCFGYIFRAPGLPVWGMISDSRMLPEFAERYKECEFLSINATFPNIKKRLDHISVEEASALLESLHPKLAVLTHLGAMLTSEEGSHCLTGLDTEKTTVTAANDGMTVDLSKIEICE